jgi:Fe-S-cluster containining protein
VDPAAMTPMREGLLAIYDELAADIARAAPVCELSGRCCRFKEYGHTLFISRPEAEFLLEQGLPENAVVDEAGCPFQINGLCTARERRPLGCRVYFCDPKYAGTGEGLSEIYIARLKQLHEETQTPWDYRPLHRFLSDDEGPHLPISL